MAGADLLGKLRRFDAYPKTLEDFRVKTFSGGARKWTIVIFINNVGSRMSSLSIVSIIMLDEAIPCKFHKVLRKEMLSFAPPYAVTKARNGPYHVSLRP